MRTLSVIVPVYNCERFLNQCVESILSQSFEDYELLLIDDGSRDSSGRICDDWASNDERISVFHIANSGVSYARNLGLESAEGKYITFIDADDYICKDFFRKAMCFMEDNPEVDYAQYSFDRVDAERVLVSECSESVVTAANVFAKAVTFMGSACFTIFKKEIICTHSIRFDVSLKLGEDQLFVYEYIHFCRKCAKLAEIVYHYRSNPASSTHTPYFKDILDSIKAFKAFKYKNEFTGKINETLFSLFMQLVMSDDVSVGYLYSIGKDMDFTGVKRDRIMLKLFCMLDRFSRKFAIFIVRKLSYVI